MRYARAIALLLAMSPASSLAANDAPKISDEQMVCAEAAKKEYQTTKAQLDQRATANGTVVSVDDTLAKRRFDEDFCRRWAACFLSDVKDANTRGNIAAATFVACLDYEVSSAKPALVRLASIPGRLAFAQLEKYCLRLDFYDGILKGSFVTSNSEGF